MYKGFAEVQIAFFVLISGLIDSSRYGLGEIGTTCLSSLVKEKVLTVMYFLLR
jgi:hypothetical protein